jgi:hypothetical protein
MRCMPADRDPQQAVEAARYALLRRLAFAMRHHMVVHLQPIGMIMEVMERRLAAPAPQLGPIHEAMGKVHTHARAAVQSSLDVVSWLAPEDGLLTPLDAGVQECIDLLRSHLAFRGFVLTGEVVAPLSRPVSRSALRNGLAAVLLVMTDHAGSPADVVIRARETERAVDVQVELRPGQGSPGYAGEPHYRLLEWPDAEAIAAAEGIALTRAAHGATLSLPA